MSTVAGSEEKMKGTALCGATEGPCGKLSGWRVPHSWSVWLGLDPLGPSPPQAAKSVLRPSRNSGSPLWWAWYSSAGATNKEMWMGGWDCVCGIMCELVRNRLRPKVMKNNYIWLILPSLALV